MLLVWGHIKDHIAAKFFSRCFVSFSFDLSAKRQPQRIKRCGCRPNSFAFRFFRIPMFCQFLTGFGGHFTAQRQRMKDVLVYPDRGTLRPEEQTFVQLLHKQAALTVK